MIQMKRDNKFDSLKGIMILLVLFCHYIEKMYPAWQDDSITRYLYYFVYLFHMPVFIFISGYFSKKNNSDDYYKKTISNCLIPYVLFNLLYCLVSSRGDIVNSLLQLPYPQWTLWFLLSLFLWRLLLRPVSMFRGAFLLSILLSLYIGFTEMGNFLSLARTFSFFPYFLAGYLIPEQAIEKVRSLNKAVILILFAFAVISLLLIQKLGVSISALYMSTPYMYLGMSGMASVGVRIFLLVTGFICIMGFIALAPEKYSFLSLFGKNSVLIYLVHSGIIRFLMHVSAISVDNGLLSVCFAVVFSFAVCVLFGNEPVVKIYRSVIGYVSRVFVKNKKTIS